MIIGISGNMNSGKDTVASILIYLNVVGKHKATFREWITKKDSYYQLYNNRIIHFANILKDNLSNILCLNRDIFDNRKFKDELWYHPSTGKFIEDKDVKDTYKKFDKLDPINTPFKNNGVIKIRTIIQEYAEWCKLIFGRNVWIYGTLKQAIDIEYIHKFVLIPDVRFDNEVSAIKEFNGKVIHINRPNNELSSNHCSENNDITYDYLIENDGTLQNLFYKVLAIYDSIRN